MVKILKYISLALVGIFTFANGQACDDVCCNWPQEVYPNTPGPTDVQTCSDYLTSLGTCGGMVGCVAGDAYNPSQILLVAPRECAWTCYGPY
jgi:hypothetical protein